MTIFKGPLPDVEVPDISITQLVMRGLESGPDEPAAIDGPTGRIVTRAEMVAGIKALAGGLTARGLAPSKTIAIMSPNLPEFIIAFHGIAWAGSTVTTINPTYTADEVRNQLVDSEAVMLITIPTFMETARAAVQGTAVTEIATIGEAEDATPITALMGDPLAEQAPVDPATDIVVLPYSSGTTGMPKGVMLTHRNLVANVAQVSAWQDSAVRPGEHTPAFLPFFHIYGMEVLANYFIGSGGCTVTMPRFDLELFLRLTQDYGCEKLWIVPPVGIALAKHPLVDKYDLSSVKQLLSGAAPMGPELSEAMHKRLGCHAFQGYGMTEMSPCSHFSSPKYQKPGSVGLTVPNTECRIRDPETGRDLGVGQEGELLVRGPQVMKGYLKRPEATAETLDGDGWLRTGDIGVFDEDGYLFIRDRLKELIKVKGFQVAPAEVEAALLSHPDIADAAVIGVPDDEAGEVPMAFVVAAPDRNVTLDTIRGHLEGHLTKYKIPERMEVVDAVPKSASGKILRRLLRDQLSALS